MIGPEYGTVSRADLVEAAKEAAEAGFDVLIAFTFAFEAQAADLQKIGRVPILKARLNHDLHLGELKTDKTSAIAVVFGEPDVEIEKLEDGRIRVRIRGVDIFDPRSGQLRSHDPRHIACWFVDTDYDGESFFVRQAYFPGMLADPFKTLKATLKGEIDEAAWDALRRTESLPFPKPSTGRIAVKVINHLGDEAMRVLRA
jgi:adenine-specific DNA-methyltransferase